MQAGTDAHGHGMARSQLLSQPGAVWAVAFACVISFMGLGLVDPILPAIAAKLNATPSQVELLFTSYMLVTGVAMLITRAVSNLIGPKGTLLTGLLFIVAFSFLGGASQSIGQIVWFRAGWGLGNALFIATALTVIVNVARGGTAGAIILYEAALGLGISVGPLLGGELGSISWRGPFYGVAVLMALAFISVSFLLKGVPRSAERPKSLGAGIRAVLRDLVEPLRALRHRGLLTIGLEALLYNFGFFTLLAFTPFVLNLDIHGLGYVFFGWGVLLAFTSVFVAPKLQSRFGTLKTMYTMLALIALDLLGMGFNIHHQVALILAVIIAGAFLGVNNTVVTTAVMQVAPVERSTASAAYSFIRFTGGAIAPWLAGKLAEWFDPRVPFFVGGCAVLVAILVLFIGRSHLRAV